MLSGETKGLDLVNLDAQKLGVAGMCYGEEDTVEPVVVGLRCMFKLISSNVLCLCPIKTGKAHIERFYRLREPKFTCSFKILT